MACASSVSQDEYDGLSADFRQSQTEVSELKSQLNIADSKLAELERQITGLSNHRSGVEISKIESKTTDGNSELVQANSSAVTVGVTVDDSQGQLLEHTSTQTSECVVQEVEVKVTKEGLPADVPDEVTEDVRTELIKSGVPSEVIEQVVREVRTELVKEVADQVSTNETGRVEKTVEMEIVIGVTDKIGHASDCDVAHQD